MNVIEHILPYNDKLEKRNVSDLEVIVLHCTELPTLALAREYGERIMYPESQTGNSGHFYIDRDGQIYRYAEENRMARHVIGHNENSIGIEIVNEGRYPNWFSSNHQNFQEPYTTEQISALKELLVFVKAQFPSLNKITRHSDLDTAWIPAEDNPDVQVRRRLDPGPLFPWQEILAFWNQL